MYNDRPTKFIHDDNTNSFSAPFGPYKFYHQATRSYHLEPEVTPSGATANPMMTPEETRLLRCFGIWATGLAAITLAIGAAGAVNKHVLKLD